MVLHSKSGCSSRGTVWFAGRLVWTPTCLPSGISEKVPGLHSPCSSLSPPRVGQGAFLTSLGLTGAWGWLLAYAMHGQVLPHQGPHGGSMSHPTSLQLSHEQHVFDPELVLTTSCLLVKMQAQGGLGWSSERPVRHVWPDTCRSMCTSIRLAQEGATVSPHAISASLGEGAPATFFN